jgi:hypothetical protein
MTPEDLIRSLQNQAVLPSEKPPLVPTWLRPKQIAQVTQLSLAAFEAAVGADRRKDDDLHYYLVQLHQQAQQAALNLGLLALAKLHETEVQHWQVGVSSAADGQRIQALATQIRTGQSAQKAIDRRDRKNYAVPELGFTDSKPSPSRRD